MILSALIVLVLVVADVSITLASKVQHLGAIVPEGHADTADGVENGEATDGFFRVAHIPQTKLTVAHAREAGCGDTIMVAHPDCSTVLCAGVTLNFVCRSFLSYIPETDLLVAASGHKHATIG